MRNRFNNISQRTVVEEQEVIEDANIGVESVSTVSSLFYRGDEGETIGGMPMPVPLYTADKLFPPRTVASTKEMDVIAETMRGGFVKYGLPGALIGVAATFLLRYRSRRAQSTVVEKFLLGGLHYYGATTLGLSIGLSMFGPEFDKHILEKLPHSDLARQIRAEQYRD